MVEESIHGRMEENMMENINMIRNMVLEYIHGLTEEDMRDNGLMENNMVEVNIFCLIVL